MGIGAVLNLLPVSGGRVFGKCFSGEPLKKGYAGPESASQSLMRPESRESERALCRASLELPYAEGFIECVAMGCTIKGDGKNYFRRLLRS